MLSEIKNMLDEKLANDPLFLEKIRWKRITPLYVSQSKGVVCCEGSSLHPSYKLYKYYWWIYPSNSKYENAGHIFYNKKYKMTTAEAVRFMDKLKEKNIKFAYVNIKLQRLGCKIWNYQELKDNNSDISFAPSYEDDNDEIWNGHK